jgi:hypothetical protein
MIHEFLINPTNNTVLATIELHNRKIVKVFCDTGGDGGEEFSNALIEYCKNGTDAEPLYFKDGKIVSVGAPPSSYHVFDFKTKQWIDPRTPEAEWKLIRSQRNALLQQSDWTQLPDVPLATKEAWAAYRQLLRDITSQPDPFNIIWPPLP